MIIETILERETIHINLLLKLQNKYHFVCHVKGHLEIQFEIYYFVYKINTGSLK